MMEKEDSGKGTTKEGLLLESLLNGMGGRGQPWFRALPVRTVILTIYKAFVSSDRIQPFHLISLGKYLIDFLLELKNISSQTGGGVEEDPDHENYLVILDSIFGRLVSLKLDQEEGFDELVELIWNLHKSGTLDLSKTEIPEKLVQRFPSRLEQEMNLSLEFDTNSLDSVTSLCENSPSNFLKVIQLLHEKFILSHGPESQLQILDFSTKLFDSLKCKLNQRHFKLFPTPFHPLLHFLNTLSISQVDLHTLPSNSIIIDEIVTLIDIMYYQCELSSLCFASFVLYSIPELMSILKTYKSCKSIPFVKWPWLKRIVKCEEFVNLSTCHKFNSIFQNK